jgi:hypothetical protein
LERADNTEQVWDRFESDVQLYVAEMAPRKLFVHAGVVGWQGRAIIIPGRSFAGKTTLVTALVKAGATYYSDEYAVLDRHGRVHPYPRPLLIRKNGASGKSSKYPIEALGGSTGTQPLPVGLIIVSQYKANARWRPRTMSAGEGVLALLANTVPARRRPADAMQILHSVASGAEMFKGARGEAEDLVNVILTQVSKANVM